MRRRDGAWVGAFAAALVLTGCGADTPAASVTESTTPTAPAPATAATSMPATSPTMGPVTPSGKPSATLPPSPAAEIGSYCLKPGDGSRKVTFPASDGATLTGAVFGRGRAGVVLVHQSNGDLCQWLPYAQELARAGYLVLTFDLEGSGTSGSVQYDGAQPAPYGLDVAGAVKYLRSQGAAKVVLVGASMGGTSALAGAAVSKPAVNGVVSLSAPAEYNGVDARTAATRLTMPVYYAASSDDGEFGNDAKTLHAATKSATKSVTLVKGGLHGVGLVQEPGVPGIRTAVAAFIAAHAR